MPLIADDSSTVHQQGMLMSSCGSFTGGTNEPDEQPDNGGVQRFCVRLIQQSQANSTEIAHHSPAWGRKGGGGAECKR